jgi:cation transport ATPase
MKLTRNINLHGVVLTIDEDAYELLKEYLTDIENHLPEAERTEVMNEVESRIAKMLQSALFSQKVQSATVEMVQNVRTRIGSPDEFGEHKRPAFKREHMTRQGVGRVLTIVLKAILIVIAIQLLFPVLAVLFGLLTAFFGFSIGGIALVPALGFDMLGGSTAWTWVLCLSALAAVVMPIYMMVHWLVKYTREHKHPSLRFWIITLLIWLLSLGGLVASAVHALETTSANIPELISTLDEWNDD